MTTWTTKLAAALAAAALAFTGCSSSDEPAAPSNTITYWLWDSAQQPGYQKCADGFEQANPGLRTYTVPTAGTSGPPSDCGAAS